MKDLQSRLDLVQWLGEIQRLEPVTRTGIKGIAGSVESIAIDDETRNHLVELRENSFVAGRVRRKWEQPTLAMKQLVPLPENHAKAFGLERAPRLFCPPSPGGLALQPPWGRQHCQPGILLAC